MKKKIAIIAFIIILGLINPVFAARPLITDDFCTVPQGAYELESGFYSISEYSTSISLLDTTLKRGFYNKFELGIELPCTLSLPSGVNDLYLHAKCKLVEFGANEGISGRVDYKLNNGNVYEGFGTGDNDYWILLIYSRMFFNIKTHVNIGYVNVGHNAGLPYDDYFLYSFAIENPIWGEKGDFVAEYVANNINIPNPALVQMGFRYALIEHFKIDAAYSIGLNADTYKNSITSGIHWEF